MRLRTCLMAGIVLPFAAATPAFAVVPTAFDRGMIVLAQADACPEGQDCAPQADDQGGGGNRKERRNRRNGGEQQQGQPDQQAEPQDQAAPDQGGGGQSRKERRNRQKSQDQQQEQSAPQEPGQSETGPSSGDQGETPKQRRARLRAEQQQQPEQPAEPAQQAAPEPPAQDAGETKKQRRDRLRTQQKQQEQVQPEQPAAAPQEAIPAQQNGAQPQQENPGETRKQRRERLKAEGQKKKQSEQEQAAPSAKPMEAAPKVEQEQPTQPEGATGAEPGQPAAEGGNKRDSALDRARKRQEELKAKEAGGKQSGGPPAAGEQPAGGGAPAVGGSTGQAGAAPVPTAPEPGKDNAANPTSTVEQQLKAQGDDKEAAKVRSLREKLRQERDKAEDTRPAEPGAPAQGQSGGANNNTGNNRDNSRDQNPDDADRYGEPWFSQDRERDRGPGRGRVVEDRGDRVIIDLGGGNRYVEPTVPDEGERLLYDARDVDVENLPRGRTRTTVYREDGSEIVTVRNRYGDIERRTRVLASGREVVLIDNRYDDEDAGGPPPLLFEPDSLPPLRVGIPEDEYIVDIGRASPQRVEQTLLAPPVERVERAYTLDEVTHNERIRDKMSRIDLDTITFEFGSSTISDSQMRSLSVLGSAMADVIEKNPDEVYLIEGHTDAVGSDEDNLILSDRRAEAVAVALSQNFDIPPENLVTEGYGEQYLKIDTQGPEQQNRRVTARRITPLLAAQKSK